MPTPLHIVVDNSTKSVHLESALNFINVHAGIIKMSDYIWHDAIIKYQEFISRDKTLGTWAFAIKLMVNGKQIAAHFELGFDTLLSAAESMRAFSTRTLHHHEKIERHENNEALGDMLYLDLATEALSKIDRDNYYYKAPYDDKITIKTIWPGLSRAEYDFKHAPDLLRIL